MSIKIFLLQFTVLHYWNILTFTNSDTDISKILTFQVYNAPVSVNTQSPPCSSNPGAFNRVGFRQLTQGTLTWSLCTVFWCDLDFLNGRNMPHIVGDSDINEIGAVCMDFNSEMWVVRNPWVCTSPYIHTDWFITTGYSSTSYIQYVQYSMHYYDCKVYVLHKLHLQAFIADMFKLKTIWILFHQ